MSLPRSSPVLVDFAPRLLLVASLFLAAIFLTGTPAEASCTEGQWYREWRVVKESWTGDYGTCVGGRYRCHSSCQEEEAYECIGGELVFRWVISTRCVDDTVCRATTGGDTSCKCCGGTATTHKECVALSCQTVSGSGVDQCTTANDCWHLSCVGSACTQVTTPDGNSDKDIDICQGDSDCATGCLCNWAERSCGNPCAAGERFREWVCRGEGVCPPPSGDSCVIDPTCQLGSTAAAWFQSDGGDVGSQSGLQSAIPTSPLPFSPSYAEEASFSLGSPPGVILVNDSLSYNLGMGRPSGEGWLAKGYEFSSKMVRYDYSFFDTNWQADSEVSGQASLSGGSIDGAPLLDGSVIRVGGNLTVSDGTVLDGVRAIILIDGTLRFVGDFTPVDSAVIFVSLGSVYLASEVTNVQAVVLSNGQIKDTAITPPPSQGLLLTGMYWANGGEDSFFSLPRTRDNLSEPVEMFSYDPEMLVLLTETFGKTRISWREVIAGKD